MRTMVLVGSLLVAAGVMGETTESDAFKQNEQLGRGVNILGYDPIWRDRAQARFQERHFRLIREAGFQSVRINLHPFRHMDQENGWRLRNRWWEVLEWAIQHATAQGLRVVLDLHEFNAIGQDPDGHKDRFLAFWQQMSQRGTKWPDAVLFELLNEPCQKLTPTLWNQWLREARDLIRAHQPDRTLVIGPAFWNSVDHLEDLDLPDSDRRIIVTVHYYKPMAFTHQGASWTGQADQVGIDWRGTEVEVAAIRQDFDKVAAWARKHRRPIFLGEFGAYDKAPMEARVRYLRTVAREAEKRGWSWAYWQFDSDFILWDMQRDTWVAPILEALIPR
ncbi:MAG: glycoside hydrolase family 5 protein [Verrucomicrobiota bacterium]|nr:glycoside hydrolase family 5 protein [Limisphaera sp.]MDW8380645.1 glycoside hydrolase family 5 protein [Verrucomicrobiota bacterium]